MFKDFEQFLRQKADWVVWLKIVLGFFVLAGSAYGALSVGNLYWEKQALVSNKNSLENSLKMVGQKLASTTLAYETEKALNTSLQAQVQNSLISLSSTVGRLDKLSKTDPELLKKYSKIYFLNENYVPSSLTYITSQYLLDPTKQLQIHTGVWPHLKLMMDDASSSGIRLEIASAYRSFGTQENLKTNYQVTYGSGANKFSADQGYSEHQLGTAVDFVTPELGPVLNIKFEKTAAYTWLTDNAYKYGFILSYFRGNDYYQFEPWHWRFVGVALATRLHNENRHFYFYDQREIDKYLVNIFD